MNRRGLALGLALAVFALPALAVQVEPLAWTPGPNSAQPSLTATREGSFALTWQQMRGTDAELHVARFDASRAAEPTAQATVARGDDWFVNWADFPSLAVLDNGDWVTFTLRKSAGSTYAYDIHLQRSLDGGATWQPPVKVNDDGQPVQHGFVSLLPDGGDRVLMVWLDGRQDTAHGAHGGPAGGHGADHHGHDEGPMTLRSAVVGREARCRHLLLLPDRSGAPRRRGHRRVSRPRRRHPRHRPAAAFQRRPVVGPDHRA